METESSESTKELFEWGRQLYLDGANASALECLRAAWEEDEHDPAIRSYYGLCIGVVERRFDEALELCQSAAKQEFYNPEQYLNLARLHEAFGFKGQAIRYLRRGLMIDPTNPIILSLVDRMGPRRGPVLTFLPRGHAVNRWLGIARHRLMQKRLWEAEIVAP